MRPRPTSSLLNLKDNIMKKKVVVIGAGITGLFTAYKLSQTGEHEVTVVEKEEYIGGISSTFQT